MKITRNTTITGVGEYVSRRNLKPPPFFANMFWTCRGLTSLSKLIEGITTKGMSAGIFAGVLRQKISVTGGVLLRLVSRASQCAFWIFATGIPTYLMDMYENLYLLASRQKKYPGSAQDNVYDILDVSSTHRFMGIDGGIYHNCLGISYLMTKYGLAIKLTNDTGIVWTEDEAQEQIDGFYERFELLKEYQDNIIDGYNKDEFMKLNDGWYLWGDNDNHRSVANARIQGFGACIMRKAVDLAVSKGIHIVFTLHDALYMQAKVGQEYKIAILRDCMREAFVHYLPEELKNTGMKIKLDPFAWSPNYEKDGELVVGKSKYVVPCSDLYLDKRAYVDYTKFSPYFEDQETELL